MAHLTFGQRLTAGLGFTAVLALLIVVVAVLAQNRVVSSKDAIINVNAQRVLDGQKLHLAIEAKGSASRAFFITRDERFLAEMERARYGFSEILAMLKRTAATDEDLRLAADLEQTEAAHHETLEAVAALARRNSPEVNQAFQDRVLPSREEVDRVIDAFISYEQSRLNEARNASTQAAQSANRLVAAIGVTIVAASLLVGFVLSRKLGTQIGSAVALVRSSSAELQATANQQATGAKEQATAMSQITTTMSELLATSRQIAESSQRVARIALQTAEAARAGGGTVDRGTESIATIRKQVDLMVSNVLDLGKGAQQIGVVLDIVSELAEQTNILAINATIEAAGAGESGKRFSVVADEIRNLADRVATSTKEIRALIDGVRSSANTTIMVTETGSKAVDAGAVQFREITVAFKQIADLVVTTTEAAREIELSTKQQSTAVEQVNMAIASVAEATRETETGSSQTVQTASQLALLSRDLLHLVQPQASA